MTDWLIHVLEGTSTIPNQIQRKNFTNFSSSIRTMLVKLGTLIKKIRQLQLTNSIYLLNLKSSNFKLKGKT